MRNKIQKRKEHNQRKKSILMKCLLRRTKDLWRMFNLLGADQKMIDLTFMTFSSILEKILIFACKTDFLYFLMS